jgi:hypothetical protein
MLAKPIKTFSGHAYVRAGYPIEKGFIVESDKPETLRRLPIPIKIVC